MRCFILSILYFQAFEFTLFVLQAKLFALTPNKNTTIFLIGFMGAGKTTFGKKLATKLQKEFIDLDKMICNANEVESIRHFIETKGMDFFRNTESETLKSLTLNGQVIATGGGTPCFFDNMDWMKAKGTVLFLNVEEGVLFSRLKTTKLEERPLLKNLDDEDLKKFIHEKLEERMPFYSRADLVFQPVKESMEHLIAHFTSAKI